ncbi:SusC/RagA family TonB-linked outer membrane protein [Pedobacter sp. MR2016-24]|uniref:SusC/RagA family TonB-linked outer membrane protein n=1 Tax=Pedobacter sp. MR2016-24 TaxID=2994466 RepID=UPI002246ADF9|nr:SusC/RagA family TonB-linked outer membrane protein [Pedobacter sp. MR2016-24]MCX2484775.1 SusC/RagA family TonB-linked outer membrane protein [Pedobacter sp. MR2016-24]
MKQFYQRCFAVLLLSLLTVAAYAQKPVTGTVTDETRNPVPGVNVKVKGTATGTVTNGEGKYSITVSEGAVLVFSMIGYTPKELTVGASSTLNVSIAENANALNEVVVTSLGIKKETKALGYAVSTVTAKEITQSGNTNFGSALYGKAAGVKITTAPGGSSSAVNVQIRGINSLSYNRQPLYVVDGVMIRNDQQNGPDGANNNGGLGNAGGNGIWSNDRIKGNGMLDINPADIESLTILKGASASALYGSDAASGVIVITTKKGSKNRGLGIDFNYTASVENAAFLPKFQNEFGPGYDAVNNQAINGNAEGWIPDAKAVGGLRPFFRAYAQFGPRFDGRDVTWWDGSVRPYSAQPDNFKDIFDTGYNSNANVSISNQTDKLNYRFSATRMDYKGITPGSTQQRNTFGINSTIKLNDKLSADVIVNYINTKTHNRSGLLGNVLNAYNGFFSRAEDMDLMKSIYQTSAGYKYSTFNSGRPEAFAYPMRATGLLDFFWNQYKNSYDENENRLLSSATLNYNIINKLKLRGRIGSDVTTATTEDKRYNEYALAYNGSESTGSYALSTGAYNIVYGDALLTYTDKIASDFDFSLTGGFQSRSEHYKDQYASTASGLISENFFALSNSLGVINNGLSDGKTRRQELLKYAYVGIANFSYKNYAFLEATGRSEYSSTLPAQNNNYNYYSFNSGFVFSEAFKLAEPFSYGKLRASYGVVGNDAPIYKANIAYNQTPLQTVNGPVPSLTLPGAYGNLDLKPERKYENEFGTELRFFKSRVGVDVSYYSNNIKNQILSLTAAPSAGATSQLVNVGEISNKGLEVSLTGTAISTPDFTWTTRLNYSSNTSKLVSLDANVPELIFYESQGSAVRVSAKPGQKLGDIMVYPRATNAAGQFLINDDGLYVIDKSRYVIGGNILPKAIGGLTNTFRYKSWTFDFTADYRFGGQMVSAPLKYAMGTGQYENTLALRETGITLEGVNETTGAVNTKHLTGAEFYMNEYDDGNNAWNEKAMIFDNSFIKMREAIIGYTVNDRFAKKIGMTNLRFSLIGRNLFYFWKTIDNLDPEAPVGNQWYSQGIDMGSTAATRSFGISLNAKF